MTMKRLTKKIGKHSSFYDCDIICNQCFNGCKVTQKVFDRLAAIEDILGYEYKLDRLRGTDKCRQRWTMLDIAL